jgi:hypothetical protein
VFIPVNAAAKVQRQAKEIDETFGDARHVDEHRIGAGPDENVGSRSGADSSQQCAARFVEPREVDPSEQSIGKRLVSFLSPQGEDLMRARVWQRLQQGGIQRGEQHDGTAETDGEDSDARACKDRVPPEREDSQPEVSEHRVRACEIRARSGAEPYVWIKPRLPPHSIICQQ